MTVSAAEFQGLDIARAAGHFVKIPLNKPVDTARHNHSSGDRNHSDPIRSLSARFLEPDGVSVALGMPSASAPDQELAALSEKRKLHPESPARVLVVDEHPMVEEWIGGVIAGEAEVVLKGHASGLDFVSSLISRGHPSLLVIEIGKDIHSGLEMVSTLSAKFPDLRILVFSSCDEVQYSTSVLRAGAHGFLSKVASGPEFLQAVRQVLIGGLYLSSAMIRHLSMNVAPAKIPPATAQDASLSKRELEVFELIGNGYRPTEIGLRISLSVKTVESYMARIREKLGLKDSRDLFHAAVKRSKARS